jgi:hypothetical protein
MDSELIHRVERYLSENVFKMERTHYIRLKDDMTKDTSTWPPVSTTDLDFDELELLHQETVHVTAVHQRKKSNHDGGIVNEGAELVDFVTASGRFVPQPNDVNDTSSESEDYDVTQL